MKITWLSKGHIFGTMLWLEAINLNASSDNFSLKFGKSQRESSFNEVNDNFQISHLKVGIKVEVVKPLSLAPLTFRHGFNWVKLSGMKKDLDF